MCVHTTSQRRKAITRAGVSIFCALWLIVFFIKEKFFCVPFFFALPVFTYFIVAWYMFSIREFAASIYRETVWRHRERTGAKERHANPIQSDKKPPKRKLVLLLSTQVCSIPDITYARTRILFLKKTGVHHYFPGSCLLYTWYRGLVPFVVSRNRLMALCFFHTNGTLRTISICLLL